MGNKFVIIGAGSTHTPGIIGSLVEKADEIQLTELCLHDIDYERVVSYTHLDVYKRQVLKTLRQQHVMMSKLLNILLEMH